MKLIVARELLNGTTRLSFTPKQRKQVFDASEGRCVGCDEALKPGWHCDHILPLALNGKHALENWQGLCPDCHLAKTRFDVTRIAKAKRQRKMVEELEPSKRPIPQRVDPWPKGGRGFPKDCRKLRSRNSFSRRDGVLKGMSDDR